MAIFLVVHILVVSFGTMDINEYDTLNFAGGDGTNDDPYLIENITHLQNMNQDLDAHYKLIDDIDANETSEWNDGKGFKPIGNSSAFFRGSLDGNEYVINGLYIDRNDTDNIGLVGYMDNLATIKNVILIDVNITGYLSVGGLVGRNNGGLIENSQTTGFVKGNEVVGGLLGRNNDGLVNNSFSTSDVNGYGRIGGLIGWNRFARVSNSYATGNVSGESRRIGGLVGYNYDIIENSYATGNVSGDWYVGGLVGYNYEGTVNNSYATGNIKGETRVSGLVALNEGVIKYSYSTGNVSGNSNTGGLVGGNIGDVLDSHAKGTITGFENIGGLIGWNHQTIENSYATGNVSGHNNIGGLVGQNYYFSSHINNSYSNVNITGESNIGGLVGWNDRGVINNSFAEGHINGTSESTGGLVGLNYGQILTSYSIVNVTGRDFVGGLVGWNTESVESSYSNSDVIGKKNVGGLIGLNDGIVYESYSTGTIRGENNTGGLSGGNAGYVFKSHANGTVDGNKSIGGLVGWSRGQVNKSFAIGDVSGELYVGGLVGHNYYFSSSVTNSYSTGNVVGIDYTGGLVGWNDRGWINESYAHGDVNGVDYTGGLVGWNRGDIYDTYSIGTVIGEQNIGGLAARNTGTINNSFWDIETSNTSSSHGGTGLNTTEMKIQGTFTDVGWDFNNTWHMIEEITYPLFIWQDLPEKTSISLELQVQLNSEGWNFISFYLIPEDTNIESILADIHGSYNHVKYFDSSTHTWNTFVPNRSDHFNNLNSWDRTMGIWIQINENTTLTIEGYVATRTDITLYPGWNMVGLPSSDDGNHYLPEEVTKIGYFDAAKEYNIEYDHDPESFIFESGKGYWIYNGMDYSVTWRI